jgi:uncharacterized protein (DUF3820 family)
MPGAGYDVSRCLYALLGDFNSNASVPHKGLDLTNSSVGEAVMARINKASPDHVLALQAGVKTTISGERYDEVIVHKKTLGRRHAQAYPRRELLLPQMQAALTEEEQRRYKSVQMGFANIMSDHLLVYVDLGVHKPHRAARAEGYVLPFGKYRGKRISEVPRRYLEWCVQQKVQANRKDFIAALVSLKVLSVSSSSPPSPEVQQVATNDKVVALPPG